MSDNVLGVRIKEELLTMAPPEIRLAIRGSALRFLIACIAETSMTQEMDRDEFISQGIGALMALGAPEEEIGWAMRDGPIEDED